MLPSAQQWVPDCRFGFKAPVSASVLLYVLNLPFGCFIWLTFYKKLNSTFSESSKILMIWSLLLPPSVMRPKLNAASNLVPKPTQISREIILVFPIPNNFLSMVWQFPLIHCWFLIVPFISTWSVNSGTRYFNTCGFCDWLAK